MKNIMNLDQNVLLALDFFAENPPPTLPINSFDLPFVVGSGNAYNTGLIIFSEKAAIFADESNFKKIIAAYKNAIHNGLIKQAVIISASGGKDSVWEITLAKKYSLVTTLLTTKGQSDAAKIADRIYVFESIDEPYTYNVSTYMGMILSVTKEKPSDIKNCINSLQFPTDFDTYKSYSFVVPDKYAQISQMIDIKKSELFGPYLSLRAFSQGHARHAKFVIKSKDELVITLGQKNEYFGFPAHRWDISLPGNINSAGIMALTYYIVGKMQNAKLAYFKENIASYVNDYGPKAYGSTKPFDLIVPGSRRI